jgi:hypothetical protein
MSFDPYQRPTPGYGQQRPPITSQPWGENPPAPDARYGAPEPDAERPARWPYAVLSGAFLLFAGAAWTAYDRGVILKDSGVQACEAMRAGTSGIKTDGEKDEPMTEAQYKQLREVFADSRHNDIQNHGTKLIDVIWQMTQAMGPSSKDPSAAADGEAFGAALLYMQPLATHMTGLQSACADQGIIVNLKTGS